MRYHISPMGRLLVQARAHCTATITHLPEATCPQLSELLQAYSTSPRDSHSGNCPYRNIHICTKCVETQLIIYINGNSTARGEQTGTSGQQNQGALLYWSVMIARKQSGKRWERAIYMRVRALPLSCVSQILHSREHWDKICTSKKITTGLRLKWWLAFLSQRYF